MNDNFYSDNLSDLFETNDEAIKFAKQVSQSSAGFSLTSFARSFRQVLATIPEIQRASHTVDLNKDELHVEYLFGMVWDLNLDSYGIKIKSMPTVTTKRELLSVISLMFDTLGNCLSAINAKTSKSYTGSSWVGPAFANRNFVKVAAIDHQLRKIASFC